MPRRRKRKRPKKPPKKVEPNRFNCEWRGGTVHCEKDYDDKKKCIRHLLCYCLYGDLYGEWEETEPLPNCTPKE